MNQNKKAETRLERGLTAFCQLHFGLIVVLVGQTIIYDSAKLLAPEVVLDRWIAISGLLAVNAVIWYLVYSRAGHLLLYKSLLLLMILADIGLAAFLVYSQRGMASNAVILFVIPIIIAGILFNRGALFATAILAIAAYSLSAVSYFVLNFNEGYKVELYGEVGFYSLLLLLIAGILSKIIKPQQ